LDFHKSISMPFQNSGKSKHIFNTKYILVVTNFIISTFNPRYILFNLLKMQKIISFISILLIFFVSTSCLEITETLTVNKDKSGKMKYELNSGQAGGLFNIISGFLDISIEDKVIIEAEKLIVELRKQPGISNIRHEFNKRRGSYFLSFEFENSKYFNEALYRMAGSKKNIFTPGYVNISNSRFKKINFSPWLKRYLEKENIEIPYSLLSEDIKFTSYTIFPDEIKRFKPANTTIEKKSNTAIQTFKLSKLTTGKANTRLKVKFKK